MTKKSERDGYWGCIVVMAALICQIMLGGICLTGGIFYIILKEAFDMSPVETSWLFSLPITCWFFATPVGSVLTNRYGYRTSAFIGGILASLGLMLSYFAPSPGYLFFSHGILTGIGFGLNFAGCLAAVNDFFDKYRTAATGITTIGHNLGLVLFSLTIPYINTTYGWRGTMLLLGATTFNLCACALVMRPVEGVPVSEVNTAKPAINLSVYKKSSFLCYCLSNLLCNTGQGIYILHLPAYAKEAGFEGNDFALVLTVYGITNVCGKIVLSLLAQHPMVDVTILYSVCLGFAGLCMGLAPVFLSPIGMYVLSGLVGFFYCVTGALFSAVIFRIVGHDRFVDGVGLSVPFKASGNLIGGPLGGVLYATSSNYSSSFILAGVIMFVAAVVMVQPICYHRRMERSNKHPDFYMVAEEEITPDILTKVALLPEEKVT